MFVCILISKVVIIKKGEIVEAKLHGECVCVCVHAFCKILVDLKVLDGYSSNIS